jgi:hypothetical protein
MEIIKKKEAIKTGWELTKKNLGFAFVVYAVYMGITFALSYLEAGVRESLGSGLVYFNIWVLTILITVLLTLGLYKIYLELYDGKKAVLVALFTGFEQYFYFLICDILLILIVAGGLILFIIPGIIWAIKYQFALYLVVDRKMKPIEAIKMSGKITMGHKVNLFLFCWVLLGVAILGLLCCCVGIIPAGIIIFFSHIHIYRKLLQDFEKSQAPKENIVHTDILFGSETMPEAKTEQNTENPINETKQVEEAQKPQEPPQSAI